MKKYIIPFELLPHLNIINKQTKRFSIPCENEAGEIIIVVAEGWAEHRQFASDNNLIEFVEDFEITI